MQIKYVEGDLFESLTTDSDPGVILIPHVCNDKGAWGAGFVVPLAQAFPDVRTAYLEWHRTNKQPDLGCHIDSTSENFGIGQVQFVEAMPKREVHGKPYPQIVVANMIAQTLGGKRPLSYKYLMKCMVAVSQKAFINACLEAEGVHPDDAGTVRIVCPMFGAGLAGGDWNFVERLIEDCWHKVPVRVHYLQRFLPDNWSPPENGIHEFNEERY